MLAKGLDMLKVAVIGLGPIGHGCARAVHSDPHMHVVGMCDLDPAKQGKALEQLGDVERPPGDGVRVTDDLTAAVRDADVAIVSTVSAFDDMAPMLRQLMQQGVDVVSSCEEMSWPWYRHAGLADQLHAEARDADCTLIGTGVNPGFVMDSLAVVLSSMLRRVTSVRCVRRVDAATRRQPLQRKVGATMTAEHFNDLASQGKIGHKGIAESVALIAAGLGTQVEPGAVVETLEPVIAEFRLDSALGSIEPGFVRGMRNTATWVGPDLRIELDLTMAIGVEDPCDKIKLEGPVPLVLKIPGSIPGDSATVAALLNVARILPVQKPGLLTMLDLPPAGSRTC
jgi:hypothetical protein